MISAVILTKNEEKNIIECLQTLSWCDEIIILDDYSTDATIKNASSLQLKQLSVYQHRLNGNFAEARNNALHKAKNEWLLFVDADERVSSSLQYEIVSSVNSSIANFSGYYMKRNDIMWGRELRYGDAGNTTLLRLARRHAGLWEGHVHEVWKIKGKTRMLKNPLFHYPHQTVAEFLREVNFYTDLRAAELYQKRVPVSFGQILLFPVGKFLKNYFLKQGLRDGISGLLLAIVMSFHSFLVRGKLWQLWQKNT